MQSLCRNFCHQALLQSNPRLKRALPLVSQKSQKLFTVPKRHFGEIEVQKKEEEQEESIDVQRKRLGIDMEFNEQKHAYILTFPWNFQEIISDFEAEHKPLPNTSYWNQFVFNSGAIPNFNKLYREFHQYCALPDFRGLDIVCEPKLSNYVMQSIQRIQFHGLDIEMANLTVEQPTFKVLKAEVYYGLSLDRSKNKPLSEYNVYKKKLLGQEYEYYQPKNDNRSFFDHMNSDYKPYTVAITVLVESPMKLFVENQNYSSILFGSNDEEYVKNVVRFEANLRWLDFAKIMPTPNKPPFDWKITDFNNVLNENPFFEEGRY